MLRQLMSICLVFTVLTVSQGLALFPQQGQRVWAEAQRTLKAEALWLSPQYLAWQRKHSDVALVSRVRAGLPQGRRPDHEFALQAAGPLSADPELLKQYPHLADYQLYELPIQAINMRDKLLRTQLRLRARAGDAMYETGLQLWPLLDREYAYTGRLGVSFKAQSRQPTIRLWAPTAQRVRLLFRNEPGRRARGALSLERKAQGVWEIEGLPTWYGRFYQFEVDVYSPYTGKIESYRVSDPYAVSLSTNSIYSQIIDLADPALAPPQWDSLLKDNTVQQAPEDMVIYELHIRDFSAHDPRIPEQDRGKYTAFTQNGLGMQHLKSLAQAGLSHIHLLPAFDIATIEEDRSRVVHPEIPKAEANSPLPQEVLAPLRAKDPYNWGYDPLHYGVPEGSYSTNPNGAQRIVEFRKMVQALAQQQLGTILDVVYNHTHGWNGGPKSVLDKVVPGYYMRRDAQGQIQQTSCCPDTASEHKMMEKLMVDTLVRWAKHYKITGFRFDLMGHHSVQNLRAVREALDALTLERDGIDGKLIYLYGEGWKFGSLDAISSNAMHQRNASGSGVGTFNDRLRDSVRGGNFDHATRSDQGFINGLYVDPNNSPSNTDTPPTREGQKAQLINYTDNIRLGLAGNLKDYVLTLSNGQRLAGSEIPYRGQPPAAYTQDPAENVNYVSAHDNYSLWDQIAAKAPFKNTERSPQSATPALRARMQQLGLAMVLLGQGVPFLHAGSEILRSKSGDGDSYDSGDHWNALNWSYQDNGWGKGLPPAWRNRAEWDFWRPRLASPVFKAGEEEILATLAQTHRLLRIRAGTALLRLKSAEEIQEQLHFLNAERGFAQLPGLIAMYIQDTHNIDPERKGLLVLLYAGPETQSFGHLILKQAGWRVHADLLKHESLKLRGEMRRVAPVASGRLQDGKVVLPPYSVTVLEQVE